MDININNKFNWNEELIITFNNRFNWNEKLIITFNQLLSSDNSKINEFKKINIYNIYPTIIILIFSFINDKKTWNALKNTCRAFYNFLNEIPIIFYDNNNMKICDCGNDKRGIYRHCRHIIYGPLCYNKNYYNYLRYSIKNLGIDYFCPVCLQFRLKFKGYYSGPRPKLCSCYSNKKNHKDKLINNSEINQIYEPCKKIDHICRLCKNFENFDKIYYNEMLLDYNQEQESSYRCNQCNKIGHFEIECSKLYGYVMIRYGYSENLKKLIDYFINRVIKMPTSNFYDKNIFNEQIKNTLTSLQYKYCNIETLIIYFPEMEEHYKICKNNINISVEFLKNLYYKI